MSLLTWKTSTLNSSTEYGYLDGKAVVSVFWKSATADGLDWKVYLDNFPSIVRLVQTRYATKDGAKEAAEAFARRWIIRVAGPVIAEELRNQSVT